MADTAAAIAAYTTVAKGTALATVELKINYLEAILGGLIRADAQVLRSGRNFVVTECDIFDEKGSFSREGPADIRRRRRTRTANVTDAYSSPPLADSSPSL